jgi:O-antigen/teichoic acid export membrane protein
MSEINSHKRISVNIISSVLQVFVVGIVYLFLYKFLLKTLGVELLGVWSIILATTSIANLANFGITSGLVKFIAEYNAKKKEDDIPKLIFTSFISIIVFFSFIIFITFFFSKPLLGLIIETKYLNIAIQILPYSLFCLFINSVGGVFTSTLEGFQKNYIKNYILVFSTLLLLITSYFLVPIYQLKGVAFAQILQAILLLIGSFLSLNSVFKTKIFNKWNWDKLIFKKLINFGLKFQIISIFQMLYEPITKGLISKFGGLAMLGYYEMASRLVNQIRALIVNANQVMIPVVTHTSNTNSEQLKDLYKKTVEITFFVNVILISGLLVFIPIISILWIGFYEPNFIFSTIILSISMFINIIVGPAYFSSIGEGKLNLILISQIIIGVLNLILGFILGIYFHGKGVITAWSISLIIGSLFLIYQYQKKRKITFKFLFSKYNATIFLFSTIFVFLNLYYFSFITEKIKNYWIIAIVLLFSFTMMAFSFLYKKEEYKLVIKRIMKL